LTAIWYHKSEIVAFRDESRAESRIVRMRAEDVAENSTTTTTTQAEGESIGLKKCTLALDGATRGLEQRACLERQRRKFISQRIIYKAAERFQNDVNGPERLADLAAKVNAWATKLAIEEGARDSLRALVDNELTFSLQLTAPITEVTENHSLKRAASEDEGTDCVKRLRPTLVCG
jgi:hypothetical protein